MRLVISEIKPVKEKLSKTMKNIDVLYSNVSLESFMKRLNDKKFLSQQKEVPKDNKMNRQHELRALDR